MSALDEINLLLAAVSKCDLIAVVGIITVVEECFSVEADDEET